VAAFFVTLLVLLFLWIVGIFGRGAGSGSQILSYLSFVDHYYNNFYQGLLDLSDAVYYASLTALALLLGSQVVEARRWR
jgi:hypothetical protein